VNPTLSTILTRQRLRKLAGTQSFSRGEDYAENGLVEELVCYENTISAKVHGTQLYKVKFWVKNNDLMYSCSCPFYSQGAFCKHCVAVGLTYLSEKDSLPPKSKSPKTSVTMNDVKDYLNKQDKEVLVNMLMEQTLEDDRLRERLLMKSARQSDKGLNLDAFRKSITNAVDAGEFVDYYSAGNYCQRIDEIIDSIEELLKDSYANETIELAEHFLSAVEDQMDNIDDSDGEMGGILARLQDIHHSACLKAKPDPVELAKRLFDWELNSDWEFFYGASETYEDVLGNEGLAVYRQLAEKVWADIPALKAGHDKSVESIDRFAITHIMESLARNTEELVAIKSRDLSTAYTYLNIAEIHKNAGQSDQALKWAEEGIKAFPEKTDSRLREFLADEYHRRKRHPEAMELIWKEFTDAPRLENYQLLKKHSDKTEQWSLWREKALDFIRQTIQQKQQKGHRKEWWWYPLDNSLLVRIFLWEKDWDTAWKEAKVGGCSNELWLELAHKREKEHPADALEIYQKQVEPLIAHMNNESYKDAVEFIKQVQQLMKQLGRNEEFTSYLAELRIRHKPKRNLMKLLEKI
jgi:uncharacterized Zn finger protein